MKKIIFFLMIFLVITGCNTKQKEVDGEISKESNIIIKDQEIKLNIDNTSLTNKGLKVILTNNSKQTIFYGNTFSIEKKQNNSWYQIKMLKEMTSAMNINKLDAQKDTTINLNWEPWYGKLPSGEYRILLKVSYNEDISDFFYVSNDFNLKY